MKPLKQALVAELTAALAPILPPTSTGTLPKGVAHAVEDLADSILRWRASQHRMPRVVSSQQISSESNALARLLEGQLHEEEAPVSETLPVPPAPMSSNVPEQPSPERKRRPRLLR